MKKHARKHKFDGGNLTRAAIAPSLSKAPMFSHGGNISAKEIATGKAAGVRKGSASSTPAQRLATGHCEGRRTGQNAKSIGMGHPAGRRAFATGGHATDMGFESKGERLKKSRERNDILGAPHYAEGGKVYEGMKALYHALHSHFENEPHMKKLGATQENVYEGEPHREKRASGGHIWIKDAINPAHKGALHKELHVPKGKKIPMSKIKKAEHSKSPLLRKRAVLAATLRKFHP